MLHSVVIVTVIIWNLSCFSHGKDGVVYASDGQSINMEYIYEFFNNRCKMKPMECSQCFLQELSKPDGEAKVLHSAGMQRGPPRPGSRRRGKE